MDLPSVKGIRVVYDSSNPSEAATQRLEALSRLNTWASPQGVLSREGLEFVVDNSGQVRCVTTRFIPAGKHLLHVPFKFDLSFTSLRTEIHPEKTWSGWTELKLKIKSFEENFRWLSERGEQKDCFTKNLQMILCIIGLLNKNRKHPNFNDRSELLQAFSCYWQSLPTEFGSVLYSWTKTELACLEGTCFASSLENIQRFGNQLYQEVFLPFVSAHSTMFCIDGRAITFEEFMQINAILLSRSFSAPASGKKERISLLPFIDLCNGKPHNCFNACLENCAIQSTINGEFYKYRVLINICDVYAGEEIFIEYAPMGNGDYLLAYNCIPLDPDVIMNNQKTEILLDFSEFLETELLRKHPDTPNMRTIKRQHVYGCFNLPKLFPMSMEEFLATSCSFTPSIRQVLIFLQFNEQDAATAIKTSRIKSQLTPQQLHHLFHMFLRFVDIAMEKVNIPLLRSVLTNQIPANTLRTMSHSAPIPLTDNMRYAIYLHMSERLVAEVMISRFISLFPEAFHELGYSIMRDHLVSNEVNAILEVLYKPVLDEQQNRCMICGSMRNISKCSRCRRAYYCSAACQKEHWPAHKQGCKPVPPALPAASTSPTQTPAAGTTTAVAGTALPLPSSFSSALLYGAKAAQKFHEKYNKKQPAGPTT